MNKTFVRRNAISILFPIGCVAFMGSLAWTGGKDPEKALETQKLIIRDENGKERIVLGTSQGVAAVVLKSEDGAKQIVLSVHPDGSSSVDLFDKNGKPLAELSSFEGSNAQLFLRESSGPIEISLAADSARSSGFGIYKGSGSDLIAGLVLTKDGVKQLRLCDDAKKCRAVIQVAQDGDPQLSLFNSNGKAKRFKAPSGNGD